MKLKNILIILFIFTVLSFLPIYPNPEPRPKIQYQPWTHGKKTPYDEKVNLWRAMS